MLILENEKSSCAVGGFARANATHSYTVAIAKTGFGGAQHYHVIAAVVCNAEFLFVAETIDYFGYWVRSLNSK